jgi:predicted Na+-dependent transporter
VAIAVGIFCSYKIDTPRWHKTSNILGNVSGLALIIFTVILAFVDDGSKSETETTYYENNIGDYFVVGIPCLMGLVIATLIASITKRPKPERLAIAVECCYQNTSINIGSTFHI